jgi:hypothetical protein
VAILSIELCLGDLVYYIGPPILSPLKWDYIVENDNGIISKNDLGIIVDLDSFLKIADVFFQKQNLTIERISFRYLKLIE